MSSKDMMGCFTLIWDIKHFSYIMGSYPEENYLRSPVFKTDDEVFWCMKAYNLEFDFKFQLTLGVLECSNFDLDRLSINNSSGEIPMKSLPSHLFSIEKRNFEFDEMFIVTSSGEIPMKSEPNHIFSIEKSLIVNNDKNSILNPQGTLTVGCRIRGETIETREYRMYSVIHKKKIQWIIEEFDDSISRYATIQGTGNLLFFMTLDKKSEERTHTLHVTGMPSIDGWNSFFDWKLYLKDNQGIVLTHKFLAKLLPIWEWNIILSALSENENLEMEFETIVGVHKDSGSSVSSLLVDDLLHMYENNTLSDATINTEGKSFPAHRSILAARSSVFRAMFEKEMTEGRSGVVDITDIDAATMSKLLNYMYSDSLEGIQLAEAPKLLYAADKYDVQSLKLGCCDILIAGLTINNVCEALVLADRHSDDLMTRTVDFIGKHPELIASKMWDEMQDNNPRIAAKVTRELYLMKAMN